MSGYLLYSTNVFLKLLIQERYRSDIHYVWCSESFDSGIASKYSMGSFIPPSSNPADIYRELKRDVKGCDMHSNKIAQQKASFKSLAVDWEVKGEISIAERDEIITMVDTVSFDYWRPLVYIIPRVRVHKRLELVGLTKRAGLGPEYIIKDLKRNEFDLIEL
jgi:hypothetical protein